MLEAVIVDLAAWMWEKNHECFYPQLVSREAGLLEYAHTLLVTGNAIIRNRQIHIEKYCRLFSFDGREKERIVSVAKAIAVAWLYEDEDELQRAMNAYCLYEDK